MSEISEYLSFSIHYDTPLLVGGLILLAVLLIALEAGYRIGVKQRKKWLNAEAGGGTMALSTMFALFGLIMAFTYASGVSRFEARKQAVVEEANVLGTAFLRADLLEEPGSTVLKEALLTYAKTRTVTREEEFNKDEKLELFNNTLRAQENLWPALEKALSQSKPGALEVSMITAMNDVIDMHTTRIAAGLDRLPAAVIWLLIFISAATIAVTGFNAGLSGYISRWRTSTLALVMVGVMMMIIDYDRPTDGFVRVSHYSLKTIIVEMEKHMTRQYD